MWRWFLLLDRFREWEPPPAGAEKGTRAQPKRLRPTEILAWSTLYGVEITPGEFELIQRIDDFRCRAKGARKFFSFARGKDAEAVKSVIRATGNVIQGVARPRAPAQPPALAPPKDSPHG